MFIGMNLATIEHKWRLEHFTLTSFCRRFGLTIDLTTVNHRLYDIFFTELKKTSTGSTADLITLDHIDFATDLTRQNSPECLYHSIWSQAQKRCWKILRSRVQKKGHSDMSPFCLAVTSPFPWLLHFKLRLSIVMGHFQMDDLQGKIQFKWMMWDTPILGTPQLLNHVKVHVSSWIRFNIW